MRRNSRTFRQRQSRTRLDQQNMVRRMVLRDVDGSDWRALGYEYEDPETGETVVEGDEDPTVPVFQGIGIYAKPVGSEGEGLILHVGGEADHPTIGGVRDEEGRKAYVAAFEEPGAGEIAVYNGQGTARILIKADGSVNVEGLQINLGDNPVLLQPVLKGTDYASAISTMIGALNTWAGATLTAMSSMADFIDPAKAAYITATNTTLAAAVTAFTAQLTAALSAKVKTE